MARIRSIKPEFWTSENIVECSPIARLLFVGMWCFCDDAGTHPASAKRLKMEVFPGDSFSDEDILGWIEELKQATLLVEYTVDGKVYWNVTGWQHQKIERPTVRYPKLPKFDEHSSNGRRDLDDTSPPEGSGEEWKGKDVYTSPYGEVCAETGQAPSSAPSKSPPEPMSEFEFPIDGKGKKTWTLSHAKLREYIRAYPSLDVPAELTKARQWLRDNPTRRKTRNGMLRFLTNWLNREQNRGGARGHPQQSRPTFDISETGVES